MVAVVMEVLVVIEKVAVIKVEVVQVLVKIVDR